MYLPSPPWSAWTLHVPAATNLIVDLFGPLDVQTAVVVVEKVTAKPEDAIALTVIRLSCSRLLGKAANVMV